jgi:bZIP-type transcription factor MBZ1
MATAVHPAMTMPPSFNNQCLDPETDAFFDFSQLPSPTPSTSRQPSNAASTITSPTNTALDGEDLQVPAKPSHEYERFKQQTGLPSGSITGINPSYNSGFPMFSSTGLDEMGLIGDSSMLGSGWNSGVPMDMDMPMSQSSYMSFNDASQSDDFVDPSAITQEEVQNVRVWPGMHQQQAALAKAQAQAQQQRQQQLSQQRQAQAAQQQPRHQQNRSTSSPLSDARTEETIARVVNQIRQQSQNSALASQDGQNLLPHVIRAKKDEEDMDEDERLLASEEGKKLSSKERRQLRNKVSARAFRSRRKEYIGQLEGEVAMKNNECNDLRTQNRALMEENARSRAFIERLLRHQAFTPFLEELSRDESLETKPIISTLSSASTTPTPTRRDVNPYQNQQFGGMSSAPQNPQIGIALMPETPVDISMLNLGSNNWGVNNMSSFNYQQPQVFAVLEVPEGPANPIDTEALSGKGFSSVFAAEDDAEVEEVKPDYPIIERPVQSQKAAPVEVEEESEDESPEFDLYRTSPAPSTVTVSAAPLENHESLFGNANPEKVFAHFELFISDAGADQRLMERFEKQCAAMESVYQRIASLTSDLDS